MAHYNLHSLSALKKKLAQFPKGAVFKWATFNIPAKGFSTHSESSSLGGEEFGSAFVFEAIVSLL